MIRDLSNILLGRITTAAPAWLDKYAGLTRAISTKLKGAKPQTWPIAYGVTDPQECDQDGTPVNAMLPDEKYKSVLWIECDQFPRRLPQNIGQPLWQVRFRVIVWLNGNKLKREDDTRVGLADVAYQNLVSALESNNEDVGNYKCINTEVIGSGPATGPAIFSRYTFNETRSQYLHFPFDFFALDVSMEFVAPRNCEEELIAEDATC